MRKKRRFATQAMLSSRFKEKIFIDHLARYNILGASL
jgi:hypothetical protein